MCDSRLDLPPGESNYTPSTRPRGYRKTPEPVDHYDLESIGLKSASARQKPPSLPSRQTVLTEKPAERANYYSWSHELM